jgi:hypothetical protein
VTNEEVQLVIEQELELLTTRVRSSAGKLRDLLAPDFSEIGASGRLWTREEIISMLVADTTQRPTAAGRTASPTGFRAAGLAIRHSEMTARVIGVDVLLLIYVTDVDGRRARRSSLWQRRGASGWQLIHHQGTPLP